MASITVTLSTICPGGNHLQFGITGSKTATVDALLSDLSDTVSDEEAVAFCKVVCKLAKAGRTNAQARTLLQAGVVVTI